MSTMTQKHGVPGQQMQSHVARKPTADRTRGAAPSPTGENTHERIQARAYQIYQARNGNGGTGDATSDWLQAECEVNGSAPEPSVGADLDIKAQARGEKLLASGE